MEVHFYFYCRRRGERRVVEATAEIQGGGFLNARQRVGYILCLTFVLIGQVS